MRSVFTMAALAALAGVQALPAQASLYTNSFAVTVNEGLGNLTEFDVANGNPYAPATSTSNTAAATFTYTGPLNFANNAAQNAGYGDTNSAFGFSTTNITAYAPNATGGNQVRFSPSDFVIADYTTLANFLASSASASGGQYGTYLTFDLGVVAAGTVLTIRHDDGIALFQGSTRVGSTVSSATEAVTDTVNITNTADTILRYSRQDGTPSILQVSVPEPMSLALLGAGLAGVVLVRRKKNAA